MSQPQAPPPVRVKPRKRLFIFLCIVFAGWIGLLLWLYFTTVYPLRYPH